MLKVLKQMAPATIRHILFAGTVTLLLTNWSGIALAEGPSPPGGALGGSVPEISLGTVGGAMTLLAGCLALVRERLRCR